MPPMRITSVMPTAMMPISEIDCTTLNRLPESRNSSWPFLLGE